MGKAGWFPQKLLWCGYSLLVYMGNYVDLFCGISWPPWDRWCRFTNSLKYPAVSVGYHLSMAEGTIYALILAYFFTLGIAGITLLMSAVLKNAYGVIIIAFL